MTKLDRAIGKILGSCLNLRKTESFFIVVDAHNRSLGQRIYHIAGQMNSNCMLIESNVKKSHDEPVAALDMVMRHVDAILVLTTNPIYHSQSLKNACHHGARILCLHNGMSTMIERTLNTDLQFIKRKSNRIADLLSIGRMAHITSGAGTDLKVPISRYKASANIGIVDEPGMLSALPAGEASIPPVKRKSSGIIMVDGSFGPLGPIKKPVELRIKDGFLAKIVGDDSAKRLRRVLKNCGPNSRNLAEFGVGTNPGAELTGMTIEDEKVLGTVHFAFGDAAYEGGRLKRPCHVDVVIKSPTVSIDGHMIMENGNLLV